MPIKMMTELGLGQTGFLASKKGHFMPNQSIIKH
jgi:hypothetical protein